jgi:hypothetical protein
MTDDVDVFGINKYEGWTANNRQVYGIRGIGPTYDKFWKNFRYKVEWEHDDWPWSYVALNEEDEAYFLVEWGKHVTFCERDKDDPPYDSVIDAPAVEPDPIAQELAKILYELINTICAKVKENP